MTHSVMLHSVMLHSVMTECKQLRQDAMQTMRCNRCAERDMQACLIIRPHPHLARHWEGWWEETVSQAACARSIGAVERVGCRRDL